MWIEVNTGILITGFVIFLARIVDVSLGTMRTIAIVQGRLKTSFVLGFVEITVWILVIAKVLREVMENPVLVIFYAGGFATGTVVGMLIERKVALGYTALRVFIPATMKGAAATIREAGYLVTVFNGEGVSGPVTELYIVCRRKELKEAIGLVKKAAPDAFYVVESGTSCDVSRVIHPFMQQPTGWRAVFKKK